jgi:uncharacterized protein
MKVFLDTNVLVSAVATRGLCADVLREVFQNHQLVICNELILEVERILHQKVGVPADLVSDYTRLLQADAIIAEPEPGFRLHIRDQDDVKLILFFVTGDQELLEMDPIQGIEIISPRGFWEKLAPPGEGSSGLRLPA